MGMTFYDMVDYDKRKILKTDVLHSREKVEFVKKGLNVTTEIELQEVPTYKKHWFPDGTLKFIIHLTLP